MVDAAQEGRFAGAGWPKNDHDFAWHDVEIYTFENFQMFEGFMDVTGLN
ncbi:hypothetical protein ABID21_001791 [Pseudorhizobium tarimense]|uniref:Uncharacterized protein n=1 Tax=Pseudorhizobium tarimense TaxID=1079109 RepID=A0ABV2H606_9HYPH